jgi:error-prone DNA polymerase
MSYTELHGRSAFSFLRGASSPEDLLGAAASVGMPALALCDRDGVFGAPRLFARAKETGGVRPIIGAEVTMDDGSVLPLLVETRTGYRNLCRLITRAKLRSEKGSAAVQWAELEEFAEGLVALTGDEEGPLRKQVEKRDNTDDVLGTLIRVFGPTRVFVEIQRHHVRGEERMNQALVELAARHRLPLLATNGVCHAAPEGRRALDVFTCIRNHTHLDAAGRLLAPNSERHLKRPEQMRELFRDLPEAVENTMRLAERLQFTLDDLGYEFPKYPVPDGHDMDSFLRERAFAGARWRYGGGVPEKVRAQMEHELALVAKLGVAGYFLIVWDIVEFCRARNIMAQGRGSAANSTVCYCLGITNVDPLRFNTLFERFLSEGRKSNWPDIDIDLPSGDRRESVIQEVYRRYGRHGAAMTANVITYRGRSAAREIGKALNISGDVLERFSALFAHGDFPHTIELQAQMEKAGLPKLHPRAGAFAGLYQRIRGLPRHLGQHSGGMVICEGQLDSVVPLENAAMPGRSVIQWDKDDCEDLGIIKVDLLGLGMMSVLQDTVELTRRHGRPVDLGQLPQDDAKTFAMMREADTIGVFQIESRAQMATLPRMKPGTFYDVCIEVAIIRPGPIQGNLTHPYLNRRSGKEPVTYYDAKVEPLLKPILERTLGVPLFQEQMLEMAMKLADFTGAEAEELRRALSFHRSTERMQKVSAKLKAALERRGHSARVVEGVLNAITSFALYGFPESHAISFAHLAYASAYLKAHCAPEFFASLLNNQPMGFYSPDTLVKDAKRHGVAVRPVCVMRSAGECVVEGMTNDEDPMTKREPAIRLGLKMVRGLGAGGIERLLVERERVPFTSLEDFKRRVVLSRDELRTLAEIGALNCFAAHRRDAMWAAERAVREDLLECGARNAECGTASPLARMDALERLRADYGGVGLTTGAHPMALLRAGLREVWRAGDLPRARHGQRVRIAGSVICRQRPGTAKGFVFISLEDETGISNAVVSPALFEARRLVITEEVFLLIEGRLQNVENVIHVRAERIERLEHGQLAGGGSHDFH